jgi:general secretion pathway protein N
LLVLARIASVAATMATIGQTEVKSDPASTNFVKENQPKKPDSAHRMATGNPLWAISMKALTATQDRPLFSPTRRPPAQRVTTLPAPPQPPIEPDRPPLVLIGTVVGEKEAIGVFLDQSTNRTVSLLSGQGQHGWLLGKVHKRDVVLRKGTAIVILPLSAGAAAPVVIAGQEPEPRLVRRQR